ncbi:TetR/AcrR family transcriptional regulator [Streptomyces roseirectus]|uniref:TetR/AcrR family transcriptional regulator n=1 Tax=Streptomyces roseirectus TaxID=2768066 RepID=A0A7H0I871_9ACTN|nr:TetR/AcrR family transcriptional regulator [Streptomyces roseirectus]QNP68987.1 TetR/AcrR family transcriptional regulator [Streptomyces roseirectus]
MSTSRRLRADAVRNSERILRAAREVYAESGPDAMLDEIARRAGVGIATLYRRFPNKEALVRAVLEQGVEENLAPLIERALVHDDPLRGLADLFDASLALAARDRNTLAAADNAGALVTELSAPFLDALAQLFRRCQDAGAIRPDLVAEDVQRLFGMLMSVLWTMDPDGAGWRRYTTLLLDALTRPDPTPLPPAAPVVSCDPVEPLSSLRGATGCTGIAGSHEGVAGPASPRTSQD